MAKKGGRPKAIDRKKRSSYVRFRCSEEEKKQISSLSKTYGISMTDYIMRKALDMKLVTNHVQMMNEIHAIGNELARSGNNINQLAKHVNALNKAGRMNQKFLPQLADLLEKHHRRQDEIRTAIREIIREMSR